MNHADTHQNTGVPQDSVPSDVRMVTALWPILLAAALGLVPFTVFSTFLVPIAEGANISTATMGSLRGLGGIAALLVGTAFAPLIDRIPKHWTAAGSLGLLGGSSVLGAAGHPLALAAFCLLIGAATAMLTPALIASAADHYATDAAAGRAATLVSATQSMTAMLAAPLVAAPAMLWGWQGDLLAVGVFAGVLAAVLLLRDPTRSVSSSQSSHKHGYWASLRSLTTVPGVVPFLFVAFLRTAAFMGYLAYLAAFYHERFDLSPGMFALVWTLSGTSFFIGNLVIGRAINQSGNTTRIGWVLITGLGIATAAMALCYLAPVLPLALICTSILGLSHAAVAACVVSLLVRRCGPLRGSALSINAAGMSLGVFIGAGVGGLSLGFGGYVATGFVFASLTLAGLVVALLGLRSGADPTEHGTSTGRSATATTQH